MRTRLLLLAMLVFAALLARPVIAQCTAPGDCPACNDTNGAPQAQMALRIDSANYQLIGTFFYENASDVNNPRPLLVNSPVIVEMLNDTIDKTYRIYTDATGNAVFNFSAYAGACMDFKVMYCPFACDDSSDCGFQNCLNYSNIPCSSNTCLASCTPKSVSNAPGVVPPKNPRCYMLLPTINTASYCPPPAPFSSVPAICFPLLLIFAVLGGGLFLSGKNPFGGFDFTAPRVGKHIRYEAKGRGVGISSGVLQSYLQGQATGALEKGAGAAVGAIGSVTGGGGAKGKAKGAALTAQINKAVVSRSGGKVQLVGGKIVGGGARSLKSVLMGAPVSPIGQGSILGNFAQLGGLVKGIVTGKPTQSALGSQIAGGFRNAIASGRAMGVVTADAGKVAYSAAAWGMLHSLLMSSGDVKAATQAMARLGSVVSQSVGVANNVTKGGVAINGVVNAGGSITMKMTVGGKTVTKEMAVKPGTIAVKMSIGGKDAVVVLDEASLRIGKFNGQVLIGTRTANVEEGKIASVWTEISGKDRSAVTDRVNINEVKDLLSTDKSAKKELERTGTATVTLSSGEKITVTVPADKDGRFSVAAVNDTNGSFSLRTAGGEVAIVKNGEPKSPFGERFDMTEIAGKLRTEDARSDIAESGKTTIKLESGEKVTVTAANVAEFDSGKFSIQTKDDKIVVVADGKIGSVGTSESPAGIGGTVNREFVAATRDMDMKGITATLGAAVTVESRFSAAEYGGAVTVVTNPLGPADTYTVIRPGDKGDANGVMFTVVAGKVTEITDSGTGKPLHQDVDIVTGIKVGSNEPGQFNRPGDGSFSTVADRALVLGAATVQTAAANQEVAYYARELATELQKTRVAEAVDRIDGLPSAVKDYLGAHPEVHTPIIEQAHAGAVETMAQRDYSERSDAFRAAHVDYEKDRQTMGSEAAYEKDLRQITGKSFETFAAEYASEVKKELYVGYAHIADKPEISQNLNSDELAKMKVDVARNAEAMAATAATEIQPGARSDSEIRLREFADYTQGEAKNTGPTKPQDELDIHKTMMANLSLPEEERAPLGGSKEAAAAEIRPVKLKEPFTSPPTATREFELRPPASEAKPQEPLARPETEAPAESAGVAKPKVERPSGSGGGEPEPPPKREREEAPKVAPSEPVEMEKPEKKPKREEQEEEKTATRKRKKPGGES